MQRGEADFTLTQMPTFLVDSDQVETPVVPGPVTANWKTTIASHTDPPSSGTNRDIDESLFVFNYDVVAIYILLCATIWMLIKWSLKKLTIVIRIPQKPQLRLAWDMMAMMFSQLTNFDRYSTFKTVKVR